MNTVTVTGGAIDLFRAKVLVSAMKLYINTGMKVNRSYTPTNMRLVASEYTGKAYPRSKQGLQQAHDDLKALVDRITDLLKE